MSTTAIVIAVLVCVFVLIAVAFTLQQVEKNTEERNALIASLKTQTRNFQYLLEGFPEGFLSSDLKLLVCQCIAESLDQLVKLERKNPQHAQQQRQLQEKITQLQAQTATSTNYQPLTNPAQIQEAQKLLNSLYNVVQRLYQNKRLTAAQAGSYGKQVQRLATRIALDSNLAAAQKALQNGKPRLAQHHYGIAIEKMSKDNADGQFTAQIAALQQRHVELEKVADAQTTNETLSDDWKSVGAETEKPLKKNIYD
ncbi:MAG TPA: hypothetical protein VFM32_03695 [Spongiibacteraceae bacterium]|nr:hypothetical protein [Spongiibacteraceae bacterium]